MVSTVSQVFWRQPWSPAAETALAAALRTLGLFIRELPSQAFDLTDGTVGGVPLPQCAFRAEAGPGWSCIHLPGGAHWGGPLALPLTRECGQPVLVLTEFEQVAWGFSLHHPVAPVTRFHSLPTLIENGPVHGPADLDGMARQLEIPAHRFGSYLRTQSPDDVSAVRAFPDDRYPLGDPWVRVDFLRAIGITYPVPSKTPGGCFFLLVTSPPDCSEPPGPPMASRMSPVKIGPGGPAIVQRE